MIKKYFVITAVAAAFATSLAHADRFNTETSSSVRALGMGNATLNTERGPYAVFYNPANIAAKNTGTNIQLVNFKLDINDTSLSQLSHLKLPTTYSLSSLYPKLQSDPGAYFSTTYSLYPNITIRNFSLGFLYEFNQGALIRNEDGSLRVRARDRLAPVAALSFRLFKGVLRFGFSTQYLTVGDADTTVLQPITASSLDFKNYIKTGGGWVHTGGATLTLPVRYLPSVSFVARNIKGTKFDKRPLLRFGDTEQLQEQPMTYDVAASATIYLGRRLEFRPEVDYRDGLNKLGGSRMQHVFGGAELVMFEFLKLRAGIAHGYLSAGLGLSTKKASLDLAVYTDELEDRLRSTPDTRYVLQYTWGLFK